MRFEYADARMPAAMTKGGVKYYLAYDQAGTLKAVANASGNVLLKRQYDSFGNILNEESTLSSEVPFGFAGGLHDRDTGLVRFGYRDYDPETGRWTAKDPILFAGGDTDLYGYCLNDPVNLVDPTGKFAWLPALAGLGIIADIVINIDFESGTDPCAGNETFTVKIPPPSMFKNGFKLPFFYGIEMQSEVKDLPIIGEVGVVTNLKLTADPSAVPSTPSINPPEL